MFCYFDYYIKSSEGHTDVLDGLSGHIGHATNNDDDLCLNKYVDFIVR